MKAKSLVRAKYIGQDGSCGYKNGTEYPIVLTTVKSNSVIKVSSSNHLPVDYSSIHKFLENWTFVKAV